MRNYVKTLSNLSGDLDSVLEFMSIKLSLNIFISRDRNLNWRHDLVLELEYFEVQVVISIIGMIFA